MWKRLTGTWQLFITKNLWICADIQWIVIQPHHKLKKQSWTSLCPVLRDVKELKTIKSGWIHIINFASVGLRTFCPVMTTFRVKCTQWTGRNQLSFEYTISKPNSRVTDGNKIECQHPPQFPQFRVYIPIQN